MVHTWARVCGEGVDSAFRLAVTWARTFAMKGRSAACCGVAFSSRDSNISYCGMRCSACKEHMYSVTCYSRHGQFRVDGVCTCAGRMSNDPMPRSLFLISFRNCALSCCTHTRVGQRVDTAFRLDAS